MKLLKLYGFTYGAKGRSTLQSLIIRDRALCGISTLDHSDRAVLKQRYVICLLHKFKQKYYQTIQSVSFWLLSQGNFLIK